MNFPGASGGETMKKIMADLRENGLKTLGGKVVYKIHDVGQSTIFDPANPSIKEKLELPSRNVVQVVLVDGTVVSARPSGTEPKIKFYVNAIASMEDGLDAAKKEANELCERIEKEINAVLAAAQ